MKMNFFNFLARKRSGLPTQESPELKSALNRKPVITAVSAKQALFDSPSDFLMSLDDDKEMMADIKEETRRNHNSKCKHLLDKLVTALDLQFVPAIKATEDGWYIWRINSEWPIRDYDIFLIIDGEMTEPVEIDSFSGKYVMESEKAYGELAGPILGR